MYNCETMLPRLQAQGYTGSLSTLKVFVHGLRPPKGGNPNYIAALHLMQ